MMKNGLQINFQFLFLLTLIQLAYQSACYTKNPFVLLGKCSDFRIQIKTIGDRSFKFNVTIEGQDKRFNDQREKLDIIFTLGGCPLQIDYELEPDNQYEWQPINNETVYKPVVYFRQVNDTLHPGGHLPLTFTINQDHYFLPHTQQKIKRNCKIKLQQQAGYCEWADLEMKLRRNGNLATHSDLKFTFSPNLQIVDNVL